MAEASELYPSCESIKALALPTAVGGAVPKACLFEDQQGLFYDQPGLFEDWPGLFEDRPDLSEDLQGLFEDLFEDRPV